MSSQVTQPHESDAGRSRDATVDSYRRLADVFHEVLSERSLDDLLHRIADTVGDLVPYDDITFYEADEAKRELRAVYASGDEAAKVLADEPFPYGVGITGWAVEHRVPVLANRAELDPRVRFVADTEPDPESLIVVPLIARGALKGTLNIYRVGFQEFLDDEFNLVVRFADAAALAIDNAHVHASLELQAQTDSLTGLWNHRSFHERLRRELMRSSAQHDTTTLVMIDIDDFKKVNDVFGHAVGDTVLAGIADVLRSAVRTSDDVCRIGGEEFAIILPGASIDDGRALGERITETITQTAFESVGTIGLSIGVSAGPLHAANPRELVACGELAMMTAKATGKGQIVVFEEGNTVRPAADNGRHGEFRSIAHLKMLHGVSAKLSRLNNVAEIGATIAEELRLLIDYHNCRVFIRDEERLELIAFRGDLTVEGPTRELFAIEVGEGVTGRVAETGVPFRTGDAANCEYGLQIEGTERLEESLIAVPFVYGHEVVGVVVVSKLGLDQFDADDQRLLEVLAGHASVALVNARLYERERREAERARALLDLSRDLSSQTELAEVVARLVAAAVRITGSHRASVWLPNRADGGLECVASIVRGSLRIDHKVSLVGVDRLALLQSQRAVPPRRGGGDADRSRARHLGSRRAAPRGADAARVGARSSRRRRTRAVPAPGARPARGNREPGSARDREHPELRDARADVPLDGRGARQRARGERRVHLLARPLDLGHGDQGRRGARARTGGAQARRAWRAVPRHRQDRRPCVDPDEARTAHSRGARDDRAASGAR